MALMVNKSGNMWECVEIRDSNRNYSFKKVEGKIL